MKKKIIILLLGAHLILVYMSTCFFNINWIPFRIQRPFIIYSEAVGAIRYDFFATDITTQPVAKCYVLDSDDQIKAEVFGTEGSAYDFKAGLPFDVLFSQKAHELSARIAAMNCYKLHPHAKVVKVMLGEFQVPLIGEYRKGKKNTFLEYYSGIYVHE
jgi:hypothetical protein